MTREQYIQLKTVLSRIFAVVFFIPFMILIIIFSCLIMLDGEGSPIYIQERIGLNGKPFKMYKLRTMRVSAEKDGAHWTIKNDPRITTIGKVLRKTKMDEIPQIFNLIKGDMNIVGPRPERQIFINEFIKTLPDFNDRLKVKPGVTGLAQVNGGYDLTVEEKLRYDQEYIENFSIWLDVKIFIKTFKVLVTGRGIR